MNLNLKTFFVVPALVVVFSAVLVLVAAFAVLALVVAFVVLGLVVVSVVVPVLVVVVDNIDHVEMDSGSILVEKPHFVG